MTNLFPPSANVSTGYIRDDPIIMLKDLTPQKDPKGGSPKTPSGGIPKSQFQPPTTPYPPYMAADPPPKVSLLHNGHLWAIVGKQALSFILGMVVAAFVFGGRAQQFSDMLTWKGEISAQVKKIDDEGTRAGKTNMTNTARDLGRLEGRMDKAEEKVGKIDTVVTKIEGIERSIEELKRKP